MNRRTVSSSSTKAAKAAEPAEAAEPSKSALSPLSWVGLVTLAVTAFAPMAWGTTYLVTTELLPAGHPFFAGLLRALPAGLIALAEKTPRHGLGDFQALRRELATIRTGRANPALVDHVRVDYYGTPTPISQIWSVSSHACRPGRRISA